MLSIALAGCGGDDFQSARDRVEERRDALLVGYETGEPARCNAFVERA